jgi:hypothetical protein
MIVDLEGAMVKPDFRENFSNLNNNFCNFECAVSKVLSVAHKPGHRNIVY